MSQIDLSYGWVSVTAALDPPGGLSPRVWFQPFVRGASMCLPLSAKEARHIARELNIAAHALEQAKPPAAPVKGKV